jgi:hypothetical protein
VTLQRYDPIRVITVTGGVAAAGAVFGALAGIVSLGITFRVLGGPLGDLSLFAFAAGLGAAAGFVLAPTATWLLLRRVPLGRAFAGLTAGTIIGAVAGWFAPVHLNVVVRPVLFGAIGFLVTAILIRLDDAGRRASDASPPN